MDTLWEHVKRHYAVYPEILGYHYLADIYETNPPKHSIDAINDMHEFVFVSSDFAFPIPDCTPIQMMTSSDSPETVMWLAQSFADFGRMHSSEWTDVPSVGFVGRIPLFVGKDGTYALHKGFEARYNELAALADSNEICLDIHAHYTPDGDSAGFWNQSRPDYKKNGPLFKNNMLANQYQVCARGNANWSLRFYETLAYGRIPIYINTAGKFPIDQQFDPDEVPFVWVNPGDDIEYEVMEFHGSLGGQEGLTEMQHECRRFYFEHFSQKAQIDYFDVKFAEFKGK